MSRSNPNKTKRRAAKKTLLIYGEGLCEEIFLKHLKGLYDRRNSGVAVTIHNAKGGCPSNIVMDSTERGNFQNIVVVIDSDGDKTKIAQAQKAAEENNIILIQNKPCLEGLLLSILEDNKSYEDKASKWCKKEFEKKYISSEKRHDMQAYKTAFPKSLLDERRKQICELNRLISLIDSTALK